MEKKKENCNIDKSPTSKEKTEKKSKEMKRMGIDMTIFK